MTPEQRFQKEVYAQNIKLKLIEVLLDKKVPIDCVLDRANPLAEWILGHKNSLHLSADNKD